MVSQRQINTELPTPKLDLDEFNALTDLLYEAVKGNQALCARLLGVNVKTWKRWEKTPPDWPWWNLVLRTIIKEVLAHLQGKRGITKHHRNRTLEALSRIPRAEVFMDEVDKLAYNYTAAEAHLRRMLREKGMFWDKLRLPANSGGYTQKTLRLAAKKLGVVKTQEGYGEHKRSYWRLPDQDDD